MTPAQMTRLAEQIAGFQKCVLALPPPHGYGYAPPGDAGPRASWLHVLQGAESGLSEPGAGRLAALIRAREPYFRQVPPLCFLDDLTTKNVLVRGGELTGLVDFDGVCYGDPLFWLGLTATAVAGDVGLRELFYVEELCRALELTGEQRQTVALYAAWISLGFVGKFGAGETDAWRARMAAARARWMEAAGKI